MIGVGKLLRCVTYRDAAAVIVLTLIGDVAIFFPGPASPKAVALALSTYDDGDDESSVKRAARARKCQRS
jgi:hypothetical protein